MTVLTDKEIFDAIRERRGTALAQGDVDAINAVLYPPKPAVLDNRQALEAELTLDEGKRLKAYRDTGGKWTIGIGHNFDDDGMAPLTRTKWDIIANGITDAECDQLFAYDIDRTEKDLDRQLPWWRSLDPVRQRVMLNMCFNMGIGNAQHGLCSFVNTLGMIQSGEYAKAADAMLNSQWAKQVGARAQRLAIMMRDGGS